MLRQTNPRAIELSGYIECLTVYIEKAIPAARVEEAAGRLDLERYEPDTSCGTTGCVFHHYHRARGRPEINWSTDFIGPVVDFSIREMGGGEFHNTWTLFGAKSPLGYRTHVANGARIRFQSELDAITAGVAA